MPPGPPSTGARRCGAGCISREARSNSMCWGGDPGLRGDALRACVAASGSPVRLLFPVSTLLYEADCTRAAAAAQRRVQGLVCQRSLIRRSSSSRPRTSPSLICALSLVEDVVAFAGGHGLVWRLLTGSCAARLRLGDHAPGAVLSATGQPARAEYRLPWLSSYCRHQVCCTVAKVNVGLIATPPAMPADLPRGACSSARCSEAEATRPRSVHGHEVRAQRVVRKPAGAGADQ